jgi:hypothetical protein
MWIDVAGCEFHEAKLSSALLKQLEAGSFAASLPFHRTEIDFKFTHESLHWLCVGRAYQRFAQQRYLARVIGIMLCHAGEVHVSTRMPRGQHLIQMIPGETKYGQPQFSIQPAKVLNGFVPTSGVRSGNGRPVLLRSEIYRTAVDPLKHKPVRCGQMKHNLPDAVRPWNGMRRRLLAGDARQSLEDSGTMPRFTLNCPPHLFFKARQFLSHSVPPPLLTKL